MVEIFFHNLFVIVVDTLIAFGGFAAGYYSKKFNMLDKIKAFLASFKKTPAANA